MKIAFKPIKREDIFFLILLVFVLVQTLYTSRGISVGDEGAYIYAAHDLCMGHIPVTENFYSNRIGTNAPYALAMKLFGWNGLQLTYVSTILFMILLIFIYIVVSEYDKVVALMSVSLLGVTKIMLVNADSVMGDLTITLMANAPVLVYFRFIISKNFAGRRPVLIGVLAGVLFVMAVLTKESVAFFFPLLCWLAYKDKKTGKRNFWIAMFGVIAVGGLLICLWYWWMTGDFFYRINAVEQGCSQSDCNYANAPWPLILKRITYQPVLFLIEDYGFGLLLLLSMLNLCRKSENKEVHFFKIYLIFTLGMWWAGPQGLPWNPVAMVHRLWLPLMVPLAINAAIILPYLIRGNITKAEKLKMCMVLVIFLLLVYFSLRWLAHDYAAVNQIQDFSQLRQWYFIIGAMLLAILLVKEESIPYYLPTHRRFIFLLVFASLVGYQVFDWMIIQAKDCLHGRFSLNTNSGVIDYHQEQSIILYVESLHPKAILTDANLAEKYHVFDGFGPNYPFIDWSTVRAGNIPKGACLLINKTRMEWARQNLTETVIYTHTTTISRFNTVPDYAAKPANFGFVLIKNTSSDELWQKQI